MYPAPGTYRSYLIEKLRLRVLPVFWRWDGLQTQPGDFPVVARKCEGREVVRWKKSLSNAGSIARSGDAQVGACRAFVEVADFLRDQLLGLVVGKAALQVVFHAVHDIGMTGGMAAERPAEGAGTGAAVCSAQGEAAGQVVILSNRVVPVFHDLRLVVFEIIQVLVVPFRNECGAWAAALADDDVLDTFPAMKAVRVPVMAFQFFLGCGRRRTACGRAHRSVEG